MNVLSQLELKNRMKTPIVINKYSCKYIDNKKDVYSIIKNKDKPQLKNIEFSRLSFLQEMET